MKTSKSFLVGDELDIAISHIASSDAACCAVAFLGDGAERIFPKGGGVKIICNLASGGTNPIAVEALMRDGHKVMQNDRLHAKVYIGAGKAVVTSANLSANGLGLVGTELAHWIEAGSYCPDVEKVSRWFERLWSGDLNTRQITPADLRVAAKRWKLRRSIRPTSSFLDFDVSTADLPLVSWWWHTKIDINPKYQRIDHDSSASSEESAFNDFYPVEGDADKTLLSAGAWLLWWKMTSDGRPNGRSKCTWFRAGPVVQGLIRSEGDIDWSDAIINLSADVPPPFDCSEPLFNSVFRKVIMRDDFETLRASDYDDSFLEPRIKEMRHFWKALKEAYRKERVQP